MSLDLDKLEALHRESSPGTWRHRKNLDDGTPHCDVIALDVDDWRIVAAGDSDVFDMRDEDAALIAEMHAALPALLQAARDLAAVTAERDALRIEQNAIAVSIGYANPDRSHFIHAIQQLVDERDAYFRDMMAKHHECREHRTRIRLLESLAEDARTVCQAVLDDYDYYREGGSALSDAARRLLAGIGGK